MRALFLLFLAFSAHAADYGISASYITLLPQSSLPTICNNGDLRYDAVSGYVKVCSGNVFSALTTNGLSNFSVASANGLAGSVATVANSTTMTLSTTVGAGLLKSNGAGGILAAVAGTDYVAAGSALLAANNLSDLNSISTARTNLGLGSFALKNSLVSGDIPNNAANTTGNAATATALAASPTQCSTGYHAVGITVTGNASCVSDSATAFPVTTKGDLLGFSTVASRVPVGTDGQLLTADSTNANGVSWKAAPTSGINQLTGEATAGPGSGSQAVTLSTSAVISKLLQSYASTTGSLSSSDSILTGIEKLDGNQQSLASSVSSLGNSKQAGPLTGDVTTSSASSAATTLATTGVTAGSYTTANITVDAKGRITAAANGTAGSASPLTTKGDIYGYNTTNARVPVGTDGQILTADSTNALGISWKTAAPGGVTSVTGTAPIVSSGGSTPNITCNTASASQPGCLASADYSTFSNKQAALTFSSPLSNVSNTVSIPAATSSVNGYLASTDWSTFNAKQPAGNYLTGTTGDVVATGPAGGGSAPATIQQNAVTPYKMANGAIAGQGTQNIGFTPTWSSGALTVTLNDATGAALSSTNVGKIQFRGATAAGYPTTATLTGAVSATVPQGATLGFSSFKNSPVYVYAYNNGGTVGLGFSGVIQPEGTLANTITYTTSGISNAIYAASALTGVPITYIGTMNVTEASAGTYTGTGWDWTTNSNARTANSQITNGLVLLGGVKITGCSSYFTNTLGSTTLGSMNANGGSGCVYTPFGGALASKYTDRPNVTIPGIPAGDVIMKYEGTASTRPYAAGDTSYYVFSDGTNNAREVSVIDTPSVSAQNNVPGFQQTLNYAAAQSNVTFEVKSYVSDSSQGQSWLYGTNANPGVILIYSVPTQASLAGSIINKNPLTSMAAYLANNGTRVTTTPTALGQYRSMYFTTASSNTLADTAPTTPISATNGFAIYGRPYNTAGTAGNPSHYEIFVGKDQSRTYAQCNVYGSTGFSNPVTIAETWSANVTIGTNCTYDPTTGLMIVDGGAPKFADTTRYLGVSYTPGGGNNFYSTGYFDVKTVDNPLAAGLSFAQDEAYLVGGAGYGSTNTGVRRFTNLVSKGSNITCTQSSTLGDSCVANAKGVYTISWGESQGNANISVTGITVNSSSLNVSGFSDNYPSPLVSGLMYTYNGSVNYSSESSSVTLNLNAGDVIRDQELNSATAATSNANRVFMRVVKIPDPLTTAQGMSGYTGEVSAQVTATANISTTANSPILFPVTSYDTAGAYSAVTGKFTAPSAGRYSVSTTSMNTTAAGSLKLYKNGALVTIITNLFNTSNLFYGSMDVQLNQGDYLTIVPDFTGTLNYSAGAYAPFVSFKKIN